MSQRAKVARLPLWCAAVLLTVSCARVVDGAAVAGSDADRREGGHGFSVDTILLDQSRMRAITGAGEHLTIIPSMDGTSPVDIDALAETAPRECRFIYDETVTFGHDLAAFHKTTFQDPPDGALISEGAAAYRDADAARGAFNALVGTVGDCANGSGGQLYVGDWNSDGTSLHLRPGGCGRDYRILSMAMLEVTFCGFAQSVSDIVMTNIAANVPR